MECSKHREQCGLNSGGERPGDLVKPREVHRTGRLERQVGEQSRLGPGPDPRGGGSGFNAGVAGSGQL